MRNARTLRQPVGRVGSTQRGVVLVAVLWVLGIVMLLATGIAAQTRTEQRLTRNLIASEQASRAAQGGVYYAMLGLLSVNADQGGTWRHPVPDLTVGKAFVQTQIHDERGKVDLNEAPQELIRGVMQAGGADFDEADRLADAVLDWRDVDDLRRLHGAEDPDYRAAGFRYGAKNAPFDTVDELQRVLGMRTELYGAVRDAFTVYSRAAQVNPFAAAPLVLNAIPGMTPDAVAAFVAARDASVAEGTPAPQFPVAEGVYVTYETGPAYRVQARAEIAATARAAVDAVVVVGPEYNATGYRIAEWNSSPY